MLPRRTPSLLNAAYNSRHFWDGGVQTLEEQVEVPILAADEMGMPNENTLVERLERIPEYRKQFDQVLRVG
jgi:cytochrome c peroxidase